MLNHILLHLIYQQNIVMNEKITLRLVLLLIFILPALSSFGQARYQEGQGIYITNGIGYRFANSIDITATFGQDPFDRDREKVSLSGSFTNYLNQGSTWGYTLGAGLAYLTNDLRAESRFTPGASISLFRKIKLSESLDLVPSLAGFVNFPEFDHQAFGTEFSIPVSIKVFGDKRLIVGPGIIFGQTDVNSIQVGPDSFQRTENITRVGLVFGFNF